MATRPTNAEITRRVTEVYNLMLGGASYDEIGAHLQDRYGLRPRAWDNYIARAKKLFEAAAAKERSYQLGLAVERLRDLYHTALAGGHLRTALAVQKELNTLLGLHAPTVQAQLPLTDWRQEMRDAGYDPDAIFGSAVQGVVERLADHASR